MRVTHILSSILTLYYICLLSSSTLAISLEEALTLSEKSNPALQESTSKIEEAGFQIKKANSGWYPSLYAGGTIFFGQLVFKQNIWDGGKTLGLTRAAKAQRERSRYEYLSAKRSAHLKIIPLFYNSVFQKRRNELLRDYATRIQRHLDREQKNARYHLVDKQRLLFLEMQEDSLEHEIRKGELEFEQSMDVLSTELGLERTEISPPSAPFVIPPTDEFSDEDLIEKAMNSSPELRAARIGQSQLIHEKEASLADESPQAFLMATYAGGRQAFTAQYFFYPAGFQVGVIAKIPIFDGFISSATKGVYQERSNQLEKEEILMRRQLTEQIVQLKKKVSFYRNEEENLKRRIVFYEKASHEIEKEYLAGATRVSMYLETMTTLRNAEIGELENRRDYLIGSNVLKQLLSEIPSS